MIEEKSILGIIVVGGLNGDIATELENLPVVLVGHVNPYNFHYIANDAEMGGYQYANHMLRLGHRKIGLISGNALISEGFTLQDGGINSDENGLLIKGIEKAFIEAEIDADANKRFYRVDANKNEYLLTKELLGEGDTATSILVTNWLGILEAMRAISDLGLKVPRDISIVGYGDNVVAMHTTPMLTCIKLFTEGIGAEAVKLLNMLIKDTSEVPRCVLWPTKLIERESCRDLGKGTSD